MLYCQEILTHVSDDRRSGILHFLDKVRHQIERFVTLVAQGLQAEHIHLLCIVQRVDLALALCGGSFIPVRSGLRQLRAQDGDLCVSFLHARAKRNF